MKILVAGWDSGGAWKPCRRWCGGRCGAAITSGCWAPNGRGAGSIPAARRISHTVDSATVIPSFASSPWNRPQTVTGARQAVPYPARRLAWPTTARHSAGARPAPSALDCAPRLYGQQVDPRVAHRIVHVIGERVLQRSHRGKLDRQPRRAGLPAWLLLNGAAGPSAAHGRPAAGGGGQADWEQRPEMAAPG
jgi:hypothetical protein